MLLLLSIRTQVLNKCSQAPIPLILFLLMMVFLKKLFEVWMRGVRRKLLTCRMGLPKRGVFHMFSMRGWIWTLIKTIEPIIILETGSIKRLQIRVSNRCKTTMTGQRILKITGKISNLKKRKIRIKEKI